MSYWSYRSYRGVQDCQCGEPQIAEEHRGSRRVTEEHRDGRRASARRTLQGSLEVWRLGSLDRPDVARLSRRTRRTKGRVSAPCAQALAPFRVFVERGVLRGGEAAPPISESANQPISRALRWSARVFVEKGAALPTVVRNRKFMQSHMLSCRGLCYSMDVSMSVSCSSSFLLSLHTEAPRRFARGLFLGRERKLKKVLAFCEALVV